MALITLAGQYLMAATYYVATNGNDSAAGTLAAPWKTLSHACASATSAGAVIQLGAGTFLETSQSHPASGVTIAGQGVSQTIVSGSASMPSAAGCYCSGVFNWTEQDAMIILPALARGNTISNLTVDGNSRAIKVGVALTRHGDPSYPWNNYTLDATNIVIHDVNFQNFTCMGLWLEEVQNAQVYNCNFNECATDDPSTVLGALNLGGVRDSQIYNCNITNLTVASGYGIKLFDRPIQNTVLHDININVKPRSIWGSSAGTGGTGYNGQDWGWTGNFAMEAGHEALINVQMYNFKLNAAFSIVLGVNSLHNGTNYIGPGYSVRFHDSTIINTYGWLVELDGDEVQLDHNYFAYLPTGGALEVFANYDSAATTLQGISVHHNVIEGIGNYVFGPASGLTNYGFYNNTVIYAANGSAASSALNLNSGATYNSLNFINNIYYCGGAVGSGSILSGAGSTAPGLVYSNNCNFNVPFGNPGGGAAYGNNLSVSPGLTLGAAAIPDPYYRPASQSSAVVDAGQVISGITTGYFGPAPDIGAYELAGNNLTNTTTALTSSLNPSTNGNNVTFTATVKTNGVTVSGATGTVTFKDGGTPLATNSVASGVATYATTALSVSSHTITAVYGGDANYTGSTSTTLTQTVNAAPTTTVVASSLNPSTNGNSVTFRATVQTNGVTAAAATGTVVFSDNGTPLATNSVASGVATYATGGLTVGTHSITAAYGGNASYAGSTSSVLTQTVSGAGGIAWSGTNAISTADATLNQPGVLVGAAAFGGTAYTVTLTNGSNVNFTADGSVATATGSYHQNNIFGFSGSGNANFDAVVSGAEYDAGPHTITVNNLNPGHQYSVLLIGLDDRSNPRTSGYGSRRAYFQDPAVTNDVSVTFLMGDNMYVKGSFTAAANTQTIIQQLPDGGYGNINVLVVYDVTSATVPTTTALTSSLNPSTNGNVVTFTATVQTNGVTAGGTTGIVVFSDTGTPLATNSVVSGAATYATGTLSVGSHSITAVYGGNSSYAGSTSTTLKQVVNPSVSTAPVTFGYSLSGSSLQLSWPEDHLGWHLQSQTNSLNGGLTTNWVKVAGSDLVTNVTITVNSINGAVFFRLTYP